MGFRIIPPKRIKKARAKSSQEVLRRLEEYLQDGIDEPVQILCGFWEDQQKAITYQEIRQIVADGTVNAETLRLWRQDYSILVADRLKPLWTDAAAAGPAGQPVLDGRSFEFNTQSPGILNWIHERGAEFVTASTQEQKEAIAALLTKKMKDGHTVDELSRLIRPCIGLTEGDTKAVTRLYDSIVENLKKEHPRMKPETIRRKAMDSAQKYAERKHRSRAMTIARTESAFAYNRGADEGVRQAQAQGLIGKCKKRWSTSGDDGVCGICSALDGVEIEMDSDFDFKGRILFSGHHQLPPAHPNCACAIEYIEVEPPIESPIGQEALPDMVDSDFGDAIEAEYIGEIDPEKTQETIQYYGDEIRTLNVENAVLIDKSGKVYHAKGDIVSVCFKGVNLEAAHITHNHPEANGIVSFGEDDFLFMKENYNIAELQAVNSHYTYSAIPLDKIKEISYNEIYLEALVRGYETGEDDLQHLAMKVLAEKGGIVYVRNPVE